MGAYVGVAICTYNIIYLKPANFMYVAFIRNLYVHMIYETGQIYVRHIYLKPIKKLYFYIGSFPSSCLTVHYDLGEVWLNEWRDDEGKALQNVTAELELRMWKHVRGQWNFKTKALWSFILTSSKLRL